MTILHIKDPKNHVLVTSQITEGGAQNNITNISAMARLTIKIFVTLCIDFVVVTAMNTYWKKDCNDVDNSQIY